MSFQRPQNLSAADSLERLKQGNQRFVEDKKQFPDQCLDRRAKLVEGQAPFAIVVTCADSRVPPELLLDQGLGNLFVIRVAGNVVDDSVLGSIEYAALHLGVNLVLVMGHQSCGAVKASVDHIDFDGPATNSHVDSIIDKIDPAVNTVLKRGDQNVLEASVKENALMVTEQIRSSDPVLAPLKEQGLVIQAGYYNLNSGAVDFLS